MWRQIIVLLCYCFLGVFSQCREVRFKNAVYQPSANGVYYRTDANCEGRDIYKHETNNLYMYFIDGWWCIHDVTCTPECYTYSTIGHLRTPDWSQYPEYIFSTWHEQNAGNWWYNYGADVDCHNNTNLSTGAIIGICVACLAAVGIVVAAIVYSCTMKKTKHHQNVLPPAAVVTPPTVYSTGASTTITTVAQPYPPAGYPGQPYPPPGYQEQPYPPPSYPGQYPAAQGPDTTYSVIVD